MFGIFFAFTSADNTENEDEKNLVVAREEPRRGGKLFLSLFRANDAVNMLNSQLQKSLSWKSLRPHPHMHAHAGSKKKFLTVESSNFRRSPVFCNQYSDDERADFSTASRYSPSAGPHVR
jgi:hypothetical protein